MANSKQRPQPSETSRQTPASRQPPATSAEQPLADFSFGDIPPYWYVCAVAIAAAFLWSYWPAVCELVYKWDTIADYSHGYLVLPLALYALWVRMDTFPFGQIHWSWIGLGVIGFSILMRMIGGLFFLGGVDGWSILVWVAGACLFCGGWRFFKWSLPGVAFLVFMIPLPYQTERLMRQPLQRIATDFSTWLLQCLGQPAIGQQNTIWLGEHQLEVETACSGLRIFVAIAVLAFAYILIVRPKWWESAILIISIVPIALISNASRIVITGLLYQYISSEAGTRFSHDFAGWMMIPLAAAQFGLVLWYLGKLFQRVEYSDMRQIFRHETT